MERVITMQRVSKEKFTDILINSEFAKTFVNIIKNKGRTIQYYCRIGLEEVMVGEIEIIKREAYFLNAKAIKLIKSLEEMTYDFF